MDLNFLSFLLLSTSLFTLTPSTTTAAAAADDTTVLSLFRSQTDPHGTLLSNWTTTTSSTACSAHWLGVNCTNNRVTAVSLPSLNLRGPIDALSSLDQLHHLNLRGNRLNGTLTPITRCLNLKHIYLSDNDFSGEIPPELSSLHRLRRLDLSNNNLAGPIPTHLSNLSRLLTLHLQNNDLSGTIPNFLNSFPQLKELNLSNNELCGPLRNSLLFRYGESSFAGNEGLCGSSPLPKCTSSQAVSSNPSSLSSSIIQESSKKHHNKPSNGVMVAIVVASSVMLLVMASFAVAYYCRNTNSTVESNSGKRRRSYSSETKVDSDGTNSSNKSKLVFYDRKKQFELEDLLRASAELIGKGILGTVYKAVLDDGCTVAVKRLKDSNPCPRKEFEEYMDVIGNLRHPNVVRFRGYYYAREEKLVVYDYMPNGSLHSLLHGNRGPGRIPLDWTTRISLILGAAKGLQTIHEAYASSRIPHGNIKSSNILLDKNWTSCISDFGLSLLLNPVRAIPRLGGYRAPEQNETKKLSQKADVYSFGVLLLEVLTGRVPSQYPSPTRRRPEEEEEEEAADLPKWVQSVVRDEWTAEVFDRELMRYKNIEEELVSTLHVAMACVTAQPEKRPTMGEVVRMIEEIRAEQSSLGEECDESRNSLSPSVCTTDAAS